MVVLMKPSSSVAGAPHGKHRCARVVVEKGVIVASQWPSQRTHRLLFLSSPSFSSSSFLGYAAMHHGQRKPTRSSTSTTRARPSAWERVPPSPPTSSTQPSWEASLRPQSPPPGIVRRQQQQQEERHQQQQHWQRQQQQQQQQQRQRQQEQQRQQHQHHPLVEEEEEEQPRRPLRPPSSLSPAPPSSSRPPFSTTSSPPRRHASPCATTAHQAPFSSCSSSSSSSFSHHHALPTSSSPPRSPTVPTPTAAFQRLSRLRARTEGAFQKMLTDLPALQRHLSPPPAFAPLTPAFDLGTLKRQVGALQDEVASRYAHQEGLFRQNVKLWELLRAVCDTADWAAAEGEVKHVHAALRERQAEVEALQHSLKEAQAVKARLLAVRGEREKARVNLKVAQEGKAEASRALAAVLADNQALEEELEQLTAAMQDLQRYLAKCQAMQQEEDLEELGEVAARFHASPSSASSLRRRRQAFALLRLAAHRSRRLREIGARFEAAGAKVLAHKALASLAQHRRVVQHARHAQARKDAVLLRSVWGAWQRHTKQEQFFQLAARRRLIRRCLAGWREVAAKGQRQKWVEAQAQKLQDKRLLRAVFQGWHHLTSHATATRQDGMDKAVAAWKRRAWKVFDRRLEQQRALLQAKGAALAAQVRRRRLREGWREWVLQWKVARFEAKRRPQRAPTTLAQCLVTWAAWARHRRVFMRAAVVKGERQWEARAVARAVQALARHARLRRRARAAGRVASKARTSRATRRALLLRWVPRAEAWRARRVLVEKGILTRRRRALRRGLRVWAGWTRGERKTRSRARPHRPGSRLHVLGVAVGRWKALVARRAREREGGREGGVVARRWQRRRKAQAFRRWRDAVLGCGGGEGGRRKGEGREGRAVLEGPRARALLQQAFNLWVRRAGTTRTMTRVGGREGGRNDGVTGSSSVVLLREIDALAAEVDAAERQLQAKVLAATTAAAAAAAAAAAEEQSREAENELEEDAAAATAYLQQQLSALKGQEGMLAAQQRAAEGRVRALKERLGRLVPSSSSSSSSSTGSGKTADSLQQKQTKKSGTASTGDVLIAARQFKALCHKQAQQVAALAAARREVAGRVREVEEQMQELMATTQREPQARARRLREKRVEKATLETRLAQLRHAVGSDGGWGGGGGGRKGGGRGGGRRERKDEQEQDQELSRVLGLDDDEEEEDEEGSWTGRGRAEAGLKASTTSTSASSPIKKRSKTLFVPSLPRGPQPPLGMRPSSSPFRRRSSVTAVGGLVFTGEGGGGEGCQEAEGEE